LALRISLKRSSLHLDYFRDDKDRICQVLTWHHPSDRRLCIVKYDLGNSYWTSRETGKQYKRILKSYSLEGQEDNLQLVKQIEPSYLYHSEMYGVDFLAVPFEKITHYYYPEVRLQEIIQENTQLDELEQKVKTLAELLHDHLKIPFENMGITGSILWKAQTEKSDIDFMIYGNSFAQDFYERFPVIYEEFPEIKPMSSEKSKRYAESISRKAGLPISLSTKYVALKSWLSVYGDTNLSLIFSPTPDEIPFNYGEQKFTPVKSIDVECTVSNSNLGYAYPSIYEIEECNILSENSSSSDLPITRILSFEGALTGFFGKDDTVVVRGLLEKVKDYKSNSEYYQIILGTKECVGNEFIVFKEDYYEYFS
jgi:predicted nucleotidyltransferase